MSYNTSDYLLFGGLRCAAAFPLEHPLEAAKLKCQSHPALASTAAIRAIQAERGFKGFYDGGCSNLAKRTVKVAYRWPAVAVLHSIWREAFPKTAESNPLAVQMATAGSIAGIETAAILPLERLFLAKVNGSQYGAFVKEQLKKEGLRSLYHGATATFLSHASSWAVFMSANHFAKKAADRIDPEGDSPLMRKSLKVLLASSALTAVDLPLEFIKTQTQLNQEFQHQRPTEVARVLFQRHGVRGFYSGLVFGFAHKAVQTLFGSAFFEEMTKTTD